MERKKKALGRGLDSLIPTRKKNYLQNIPVDQLIPNKYQPRSSIKYDQSFKELVDSIISVGVVEPIIVTEVDEKYMIIAGERRLRAAIEAGLTEVPAIIKEEASEKEIMEMALIENLHRADLNPIEEAHAFKRLIDEFGYTHEEIAKKISVSRTKVTNLLRLLSLPDEVKDMLLENLITEGHARALLSLDNPKLIVATAKEIVKNNLNVRQTEELVKNIKNKMKPVSKREKRIDPNLNELASRLSSRLKNKVEIKGTTKKGKIIIHYYNENELEKFAKHLSNFTGEN